MEIEGSLKTIIFEADDSAYKVLKLSTGRDDIIATGIFPFIEPLVKYRFTGEMITTEKYGDQLKVSSFEKIEYTDKDGLIQYLSGKQFKGIGKKIATLIVDELGLNCIDIIKKNPEKLKIKGISSTNAKEIVAALKENSKNEETYITLYSYGLTPKMASKIYYLYGDKTLEIIKENPYQLMHDLDGYGFLKADILAIHMGIKYNDDKRIKEGILYTISEACQQKGYTFLTKNQLIKTSLNLLTRKLPDSVNEDEILNALKELELDNRLIAKEDRYYPLYLYKAEQNSKKRLLEIQNSKFDLVDEKKIDIYINDAENNIGFKLTELQKVAIKKTVESKISIITGGPGTGKTTIIKALLMVEASINKETITDDKFVNRTLLLAPTGKAAKRLGMSTNMHSETIHHALGYSEGGDFKKGPLDPIMQTLVIVDESSMIDISLLSSFLDALKNSTKLVFVGDDNQLPSVGPGNVLSELINSNIFQVTKLKEIMRQKSDSNIIKLSQMIFQKKIDYNIFNERREVFFYNAEAQTVLANIEKIVGAFISKGGDLKKDLEILAPMYSGVCGIDAINKMIQEKFNNNSFIYEKNNKAYKIGDKVLQLQNNPELGIMNGDDGFILEYEKKNNKEILYINFNGKIVQYDTANIDNLTLGYAVSIHKSQGSEYNNVIIPIVPSFYIMLKPKLIYTAFTRAKEKLIILGKPETLNQALYQSDEKRQTSLFLDNQDTNHIIYIDDPDIPFDTLGEQNMENISPYDFMD